MLGINVVLHVEMFVTVFVPVNAFQLHGKRNQVNV
ncbi:unnamed protein product [Trichobilharzia regenti]|nr:unnamed protein product [Trichobilharzia regenti]